VDALEQKVIEVVSRITRVPASTIDPDEDLRVAYNVDSLQGLQIVAAVERAFDVRVRDDEIDFYTTVRSIADTIRRLKPS
jgi:acyl carrier protein